MNIHAKFNKTQDQKTQVYFKKVLTGIRWSIDYQ